jgi:hypothetical protein
VGESIFPNLMHLDRVVLEPSPRRERHEMNDTTQRMSEQPAAGQPHSSESRLKMHLRLVRLAGEVYRVVTLRPSIRICFSTNYYHHTWHIVSNQCGARLLARLLWGLSYQCQPGTLLLVHGDHLLPTPFEAERSDPFLLAQTGLTRLDASALRALKEHLNHLGPPTNTIRWHAFGLDATLAGQQQPLEGLRLREDRPLWKQEQMQRLGGFIVYSAPPAVLRQQALVIHSLQVSNDGPSREMDYHFLAQECSRGLWVDGEVQIFADYTERVAAAAQARQELVPQPNQPILSEQLQEDISRLRDRIKARRSKARHRA